MHCLKLRVAAVQMTSVNRAVEANLRRAEALAEKAAKQGAQLALLPELFAAGFELNEHAWETAEPQGGGIERWLCGTARRLNLYIGGSYLEARRGDFYDTFVLASPQGMVAGRVGKRHPCSIEAYIFKAAKGRQAIETELGRIGVMICYDSSLREVADAVIEEGADILLLPFSAPTPPKSLFHTQRKIDAYHASFRDGATQYARLLGIPAVMANKSGPWETTLPGFWPAQRSTFPGFSHIADSDGRELCRLGNDEGVIVAEVTLAPDRKPKRLPPERDKWKPWLGPVPFEFRLFAPIEALGRRWYGAGTRSIGDREHDQPHLRQAAAAQHPLRVTI